jgi:hypothetical protein
LLIGYYCVLGSDDLYAEAGYTALSRGRYENRLYLTTHDAPDIDHHGAPEDDDPIEDIRAALHRSERQELASARLSGRLPARIALPPIPDRHSPDLDRHAAPEHDDGIDLGW